MKFLPEDQYHNNIIPLNVIYSGDDFSKPDVLTFIYKDIDTGQKGVLQIERPEIEVYICKPELRNYTHFRDWFKIEDCTKHKVHYRSRWSEIGKIMGISKDEARVSPYVFNADLNIENYYILNFIHEYPTDKAIELSIGYLDIENDIIRTDKFPEAGKYPINLVTYIDGSTKNAYTFILCKDDIPVGKKLPSLKPIYTEDGLRNELYSQIDKFKKSGPELQKKVHEMFDESYGSDFEYNFLLFDTEIELLKTLWDVIHACDNDYVEIWNEPYDLQNLILRLSELGYDPNDIIPDDRIELRSPISFYEDTNPVVHKRKHLAKLNTMCTFVDDMVQYAGIRSGRGKLQSTKLNYIAQKELKDTKLDYSESAELRYLYYVDFETAVIYNLKDVLLQYGIETHTKDMNTIYSRLYKNMCLPHQSFTTTLIVLYSFALFAFQRGYVLGTNKNKLKNVKRVNDYQALLDKIDPNIGEIDIEELVDLEDDESEEEDNSDKKKKKYQGAYVMNPLYMQPTGTKILGKDAKYVHQFVADEDIGSEYPTATSIDNICNETLVGKVFLDNEDDIDIPIYDSFEFKGDEYSKYKVNKSNFLIDSYAEKEYLEFGRIFLDLPSPSEVFEELDKHIEEVLK